MGDVTEFRPKVIPIAKTPTPKATPKGDSKGRSRNVTPPLDLPPARLGYKRQRSYALFGFTHDRSVVSHQMTIETDLVVPELAFPAMIERVFPKGKKSPFGFAIFTGPKFGGTTPHGPCPHGGSAA